MSFFAIYLVYIAVVARAIGWNQETAPIPTVIWVLLAIFGVILFSERFVSRRFPLYPRFYTLVQSALVISMLYSAPTMDFLDMLFMPLAFQAVLFFGDLVGFSLIGVFSLALAGTFLFGMELEAGVTMVIAGSCANLLMGSFAHLISRTEANRQENHRLFGDLQEAYRQLKDSAAQAQALAAATERHHLVRELHDSLTQTLFSMNLAVQSAQLAVDESPAQAGEHLLRLQALARNAAGEVQALTGQIPYRSFSESELPVALNKLAQERLAQDGLQVTLEVTGNRTLPPAVQANLYRIIQEALNNVTRHAGVRKALVRLNQKTPLASLEIIDEGCGFDSTNTQPLSGFGLVGMSARASEIGWDLVIESEPGRGTHIRLEEKTV